MANRIYVINDKGTFRIYADDPFEYVYVSPEDCFRFPMIAHKLTDEILSDVEEIAKNCRESADLDNWRE